MRPCLRREDEDEDEDKDDVAAEADEAARAGAELDSAAAEVDRPAAGAFAFGSEIAFMADSATVVATRLLAGTRVTVRPMAVKQNTQCCCGSSRTMSDGADEWK